MPGGSKAGGGLKTKKSAFYLKSGNKPTFKAMGSSPVKQAGEEFRTAEAEEAADIVRGGDVSVTDDTYPGAGQDPNEPIFKD